jgi:hypothetical protein
MVGIVIIGGFTLIWGWIIYELYNAPEFDEDENPIDKDVL